VTARLQRAPLAQAPAPVAWGSTPAAHRRYTPGRQPRPWRSRPRNFLGRWHAPWPTLSAAAGPYGSAGSNTTAIAGYSNSTVGHGTVGAGVGLDPRGAHHRGSSPLPLPTSTTSSQPWSPSRPSRTEFANSHWGPGSRPQFGSRPQWVWRGVGECRHGGGGRVLDSSATGHLGSRQRGPRVVHRVSPGVAAPRGLHAPPVSPSPSAASPSPLTPTYLPSPSLPHSPLPSLPRTPPLPPLPPLPTPLTTSPHLPTAHSAPPAGVQLPATTPGQPPVHRGCRGCAAL